MYHRLWTVVNIVIIVGSMIYIWFFSSHDSSSIITSQFLAQIGIILFFINVNMYFIFLVIRKTKIRNIKIHLAKFSRIMMKWHIKIGILGTIIIIGHAVINLTQVGPVIGFTHIKLLTGYLAILCLSVTLFAGYLRHKRASGFRRKFHLVSAFIFLAAFLIHMFIVI